LWKTYDTKENKEEDDHYSEVQTTDSADDGNCAVGSNGEVFTRRITRHRRVLVARGERALI